MIKKGVSSVVGPILIVMVVVISAGIFLSVYLRSVRDVVNRDLPLCAGIDLAPTWCIAFPANTPFPNGGYLDENGLYFAVERFPGGGEIRDLRFRITDSEGKSHVERPVNVTVPGYRILTDYSVLVEHSTIEAAAKPIDYSPATPCEVTVGAVVGDSNTICTPTSEPIECLLYIPGNLTAVPPVPARLDPMPFCP